MYYRREIDGLRAVAVLPVIFFHAGFSLFAGGYVGVDIFFVISGYLITAILIRDLEGNSFSLAHFYERRARRILPALFFMMLCCLPFAWVWMLPSQFKDFSQALVAVSVFASNILFWRQTDYFAPAAEENPLLHTWSLAVEEQFYIIFPILLWLLWRHGRGTVFWVVLGLCVLSLGIAEWGWRNSPSANFYFLVTRGWELGAGALCAFMLQGRALRPHGGLAALGLGLIMVSIFAFDGATPFPSLFTLVPVVGTMLIILHAGPKTGVARLLSLRLVVGVGLISYSAYLWHQPLFAFARIRSLGHVDAVLMLGLAVLSLGLAWLSWRYVERPFRHGGGTLPRRAGVFAASLAGLATFIGIGLYGHLSDGRQMAWRATNPEQAQIYDLLVAARAERRVLPSDEACRFHANTLDAEVRARLKACADAHGPGLMVVGDSHARDLYRGYFEVWEGAFLFGLVENNCRPYEESPPCALDRIAGLLDDRPNLFSEIHYTQAGYDLLEMTRGARGRDILRDVSPTDRLDPTGYRPVAGKIDAVFDYLEDLSAHGPVVFVGPRLEPQIPWQALIRLGCDHDFTLRPGQRAVFQTIDTALAARAAGSDIAYVSQIQGMNLDMRRDFMTCDILYWADGDHWTQAGAERFVERLISRDALGLP